MAAIALQEISKRFGKVAALSKLNLIVNPRDRLMLLGRSGAGKTTLLRILCGLDRPDFGRVLFNSQDVTDRAPRSRNTALVTQDYALYPQQNVEQNLATALTAVRLSSAEQQRRIAETLAWFGIADLSRRLPSQLSGGQLQRVALAKAIVRRPSLLVLDEPLSQVDTILRSEIRELIRSTVERFETTLVMVTHDPLDALLLGSQIAIVEAGSIVQIGAPQELYLKPSSRLVAELLSPFGVNWLDWRLLSSSPSVEYRGALTVGRSLLGFRPEHVVSWNNTQEMATDFISFSAQVTQVQSCGFAQLAHATLDGHPLRIINPTERFSTGPTRLAVRKHHCIWLEV